MPSKPSKLFEGLIDLLPTPHTTWTEADRREWYALLHQMVLVVYGRAPKPQMTADHGILDIV